MAGFDPWASTNQGLSNLTNTLGTLAQLKRQDQQYADEAPLRSLQMQQAQQGVEQQGLTLANLKGQQNAMIGRYGTKDQTDPLARAYEFQAGEQEAAEQQKAQMEKQKFAFDAFTKVQDAVKNRLIDPAKAGDFYHTQMKIAGLDLDGAGVKMEFMDRGSYFSGPITPEALFMVNGKPTPYGGNGTIEKARIVGQDPQTGKPIFEMDEHTAFKQAEVPKEAPETWGEPYQDSIGGKKAMLQKSSRGRVQPVIQDTSTTVVVKPGNHGNGHGDSPDEFSKWSKEEKQWWFENQKATGQKPDLGAGGASSKARQQYTREYAAWNRGEGVRGIDAAVEGEAFKADSAAFKASISQQQKQVGAMGSFVKNMGAQISRVDQLAKELSTFDTRLLNIPLRAVRGRVVGSPQQAKYDMYLAEIESEIGKLATGSAGSVSELSVGAQEKWAKIHDKNLSIKDMQSLLKETKHAGELRMKSVQEQLEETRKQQRNRGKTDVGAGNTEVGTSFIASQYDAYRKANLPDADIQGRIYSKLKAQKWTNKQIAAAWQAYKGQ